MYGQINRQTGQKIERQTQTNGQTDTSVSRAGKERKGQIAMERGK